MRQVYIRDVSLLFSHIKELGEELAKIKSDSSMKAIIDWKEWIDKRPRSPVWEEKGGEDGKDLL